MSHVKRIFVWTILLIGSAVLFYMWANNQMFMIQKEESAYVEPLIVVSPMPKVASSSAEFYTVSTSSLMQILMEKDLNKDEWSSSTLKISSTTIDSTDFSFVFPNRSSDLYQGCTYRIDLDLGTSTQPNYMGVLLVDLGTQKEVKAKDSGLVYSLTFKDQKFLWSVGNIWPGEYYLSIPMINGKEVVVKSERFSIYEKPEGYVCEK